MAICPACRKHFREPEDEQDEHDCPSCGFSREYETEEESE